MVTHVITVNDKFIEIVKDGSESYVAIKPICDAIGVKYDKQIDKINSDDILSQLTPLRGVVAADGKTREMRVIPLRYVFGWLFTISLNKVKPEIKEEMIAYKKQCYDALFDSFTKRTSILKEKATLQIEIEQLEDDIKQDERYIKIQELKKSVKNASQRLNTLDKTVINEQLDLFKERVKS